jgi:hypothetical protein
MTTHLPHWSKLSFHKKPTKLVATDASPPPPIMQTPLVASSAAAAAGSRRSPSTVFTDDSCSSGSPRLEEEKGAAAAVGGDGDSEGEEEENGGEIESKEEDLYTDKKEIKFSSYIRKFRVEQLQSHMRRPLVIYDFATAPP